MEQTKFMSKAEKRAAREIIEFAESKGVQFFQFEATGVTVAVKRTGREMIQFGVAIASPEENKFRKLIGKERALDRLDFGPMPAVCPADMIEAFAQHLAWLVG